jgi:hypothetical protein
MNLTRNTTRQPEQADAPRSSRGAGLLRLALYVICVAAVSGLWLVHRAHAELSRRALSLGREIALTLPPQTRQTGTTALRVNGQDASLNSTVVSEPIDLVLDRFEGLCASQSGAIQQQLHDAIRKGAKLPKPETFGIFRSERGQREATAACFSRTGRGGLTSLINDMGRALETGDLAQLGQFRYVFARIAQDKKSSHVITVWSRGALNVAQMFPEHGDAPGADLAPGARPPNSTRVLSAETMHHEMNAVLYESASDAESALDAYGSSLVEAGYGSVLSPKAVADLPVHMRVYRHGESDEVYLLAQRTGDKTLVIGLRPNNRGYVTLSF